MKKTELIDYFTEAEWEQLCDHCGVCCFYKLQDEDTREIFYTKVVCQFFNCETSQCTCYANRFEKMPTCTKISPDRMDVLPKWLPYHCAYRCLYENRSFPSWHPLNTGEENNSELLQKINALIHASSCNKKSFSDIFELKQNAVPAVLDKNFENQLIDNVLDDWLL